MNTRTRRLQAEHRQATALAGRCRCLACGAPAPSEPAHWPTHRGMGGGKAGWHPDEWVPLCRRCHRTLDGHQAISEGAIAACERIRDQVARKASAWRKWARGQWRPNAGTDTD